MGRRRGRRLRIVLAAAVLVATLATSTGALGRSSTDDVELAILLLNSRGELVVGAKTTTSPFKLAFEIGVDSGTPQDVTLRTELPPGLEWGDDAPDPSEFCTGTAPAVCTQELSLGPAGTLGAGWNWDIVADRSGSYEVTASVQSERTDSNPSNNTATLRFEIVAASGGGGSGGGAVSVSASAVKLTPAKPKAGSVVVASATVVADGAPVKPSKVACTGTLAGKKVAGKGSSATGKASCRYATPKSAKGKTITKRFAAKLR